MEGLFSLLGTVLKLGGLAIVACLIYTLIRSKIMSPIAMIVWIATTVGLCVLAWSTSNDNHIIDLIVHGLVPAAISLMAGGVTYQMNGEGLGQYIGVVAGGIVGYLLTLLLSTFLSNIVTVILAIALIAILVVFVFAPMASKYDAERAREQQLKDKIGGLDANEVRELNRLTRNKNDPERDRAINEYNKYHPNDQLSDRDK
ncbi:MAG: hypothetical protein IJC56_01380 [Clostridia bacterium]|nr:hypothetical protein [Clostridia bacterium]